MPKAIRETTTKRSAPAIKPNDCEAIVEYLEGHIGILRHLAYLLAGHIDWGLKPSRGTTDKSGDITLRFRAEYIDVTIWLVDELWSRLADLNQLTLDFANASTEQREGAVL